MVRSVRLVTSGYRGVRGPWRPWPALAQRASSPSPTVSISHHALNSACGRRFQGDGHPRSRRHGRDIHVGLGGVAVALAQATAPRRAVLCRGRRGGGGGGVATALFAVGDFNRTGISTILTHDPGTGPQRGCRAT